MRLNDDIVQCETSLAQQSDPCLIRLQTLEARQATGQISNQIEPLSQRERWRCRCPSLVSQRFCALRTADVIRSHTGPQRWITGHYAGRRDLLLADALPRLRQATRPLAGGRCNTGAGTQPREQIQTDLGTLAFALQNVTTIESRLARIEDPMRGLAAKTSDPVPELTQGRQALTSAACACSSGDSDQGADPKAPVGEIRIQLASGHADSA